MLRSLFLKIFFWFWLTIGVLIAVSVLVIITTESEPLTQRWMDLRENAITVYLQTAIELYENEGPGKFQELLLRLSRNTNVQVVVFDSQQREITGFSPLPNAHKLAALVSPQRRTVMENDGQGALTAHLVTSISGKSYVFVAQPPKLPLVFFRVPFGVRLARGLAIFAMAGLLCFLLARYLTAPVAKLRDATRRLATGDLSARVGARQEKRRDELIELGEDFDAMAERIEGLMTAQKRLLSDISHELRSPLTRLSVALELARQRAGADATPLLDRIGHESERLNELIGQLLTLAKLEDSPHTSGQEIVNLAHLVREVAADADFEANSKQRSVQVLRADDCRLAGSGELLRRAIENVVRNAIRYTREGTAVEIKLTQEGNWARLIVRDHGAGVPDAALKDLFRPFYRVAAARERQTGGLGLGLAITERAVTLHHGTITATNVHGGGLQIEMRLPLMKA
jgi:two-component system sensor histidine kinase CpxA